uniref:Glycosyltransferase 2-like domain-containing protein n=1 Tax=viral metagenome TaxID=1070528 RepID=A0A6C0BJP2_9ZZZZ
MEWIILDDNSDSQQLFDNLSERLPNIRYITQSPGKMGSKLNRLCKEARGKIIVVMDDDDYYRPTRVSSVVEAFQQYPKKKIAGCSKVYMYNVETGDIYVAGPYHNKHALNCTLAFRSTYLYNHSYDDEEPCAVEGRLTNNFTEPMIQLPSNQTILHMIHSSNTFKQKMSINCLEKTNFQLEYFIPNPEIKYYVSELSVSSVPSSE